MFRALDVWIIEVLFTVKMVKGWLVLCRWFQVLLEESWTVKKFGFLKDLEDFDPIWQGLCANI